MSTRRTTTTTTAMIMGVGSLDRDRDRLVVDSVSGVIWVEVSVAGIIVPVDKSGVLVVVGSGMCGMQGK